MRPAVVRHRPVAALAWLALLLTTALLPRVALAVPVQGENIEVELVARSTALAAGDNTLALRVKPAAGWHVYWRNPGDSGLPTKLSFPALPAGVTAGALQWPYPHLHTLAELTNYGYGDETLLPFTLTLAADVASPVQLQAKASWLVCADICIPGKADLALELPVAATAQADPAHAALFAKADAELPKTAALSPQTFAADAHEFRLEVGGLPAGTDHAEFFPYEGALIAYSSPRRLEFADGGARVRLARGASADFLKAPERVRGVLVTRVGDRATAFEIDAAAGSVAAVTAKAMAANEPGAAADGAAEASSIGLGLALALAFAGGLILNLMPCVFPVLSLKALSVMKVQGAAASEHRAHALAYTGGVLGSFVLAAGVLVGLRAGGAALGWGFQLQSPAFVGLLVYVMVALGLSMSGVASFGARWMGAGQSLAARPGLAGSFFTGVLAVVVASPCTAPFMGSALGYALVQPPVAALAVFAALGLGLAFPFLLLGFVPRLAAWLPRPGAWMETLKQVLAFPLYLTAAWLLWVLGGLTDRNGMGLALVGVVVLAFGVWLLGRATRAGARIVALAAVAGAIALLFHPLLRAAPAGGVAAVAEGWEPYSDARLDELRAARRTVFVDFTADWCLTCKVNERVALHSQKVIDAFARHQVVAMTADWTRADPAITATLARYRRSGVPLYLVSVAGAEPTVLPQVLTPDLVAAAVAGP